MRVCISSKVARADDAPFFFLAECFFEKVKHACKAALPAGGAGLQRGGVVTFRGDAAAVLVARQQQNAQRDLECLLSPR